MKKESVSLKVNWEATWIEDFEIMRKIGHRAWTLCLYMRVCDPPEGYPRGYCELSELKVHRELGWNPRTTRKCFKILIQNGYIVPQGYCLYIVHKWRRLSTDSVKSAESKPKQLGIKCRPTSALSADLPRHKVPTDSALSADPLYNRDRDTEIQREKDSASPVENFGETARIDDSELPSLRSLYSFDQREDLKRHLMATRGFNEKQVSDTFERVYTREYTGKGG